MEKTTFIFIGGFIIVVTMLFVLSLIGCSDTFYTGSMLQPGDVDKYISRSGSGEICLNNDGDSICHNLIQSRKRTQIYIQQQQVVYAFYYDNAILLQAERVDAVPDNTDAAIDANNDVSGDNTDAVVNDESGDDNAQDTPTDDNSNGETEVDTSDASVEPVVPDGASIRRKTAGWIVRIYYQNGIPDGATPTLEGSGFLITVLEADGTDITHKVHSVELISTDDADAIRFFAPSTQHSITVRVKGLIGTDRVTTFTVDTQGNVNADDGSDTFQTE